MGFMDIFSGGTKKKTEANTTVKTNTKTSIRDIGFTGSNAVEISTALANANVAAINAMKSLRQNDTEVLKSVVNKTPFQTTVVVGALVVAALAVVYS